MGSLGLLHPALALLFGNFFKGGLSSVDFQLVKTRHRLDSLKGPLMILQIQSTRSRKVR
jgi:hypothetical protein